MKSKATQTGPRQTALARSGSSGSRIREASPLARMAEVLRDHGFTVRLRTTGSLDLDVGTTRFTAHLVRDGAGGIELRAKREGRRSILGLLSDPLEAAEMLVRSAAMMQGWVLAGEIHDRLVLAGDTTVLAEVPMGDEVFVRLGPRSYAEFEAEAADPCAMYPAAVRLTTYITADPVDRDWSLRPLRHGEFAIRGRIAGGEHTDAESALEALARHRARASEWEALH
jgi:hypothetical protein